ncbi:MAG: aminotransferase class IV [Peptostreptococcaceae bacterium]
MENFKDSDLFKFGIGLFETIKITDKPIYLNLHLKRLKNAIDELGLNYNIENLECEILDFIENKKLKNKALRVTVYDGGYEFTSRSFSYKESFNLAVCDKKRGESIIYKHKTCNYFENIYYKNLALKNNYDDYLFIDYNNFLLETTISNIFFIKDDKVYTPSSNLYFLCGIIRNRIVEICIDNNIEVTESKININSINNFDFCFVSNSLMNIIKVEKIGEISYNKENIIFDKIKEILKQEN